MSGRPIRRSLMGSGVLLAAMAIGWPAQAAFAGHMQPLHEKKHDAKRQVEALEEQWRQAQLAGDVAAMDKLLSDDYIGISMTGQVNTKMQQLDRMRTRKFVLTKLDLGEMQVKLVGSIAIVTSRAQVEGTNEGVAVQGTYRYTRVYQRLPSGGWKITSFEATRVPGSRDPGNHDAAAPKAASSAPQDGPS
ncbi:ketosteroid isomerase-like protein [Edaphobacter lichenicola]|uniref:Ketosteroid isomerase-like protein n=2 Tax=Tunturiibacter TaxID=3154218 RepID=A0A7W8J9D2_9BACT|nr:ketosteroid isomerase-like protein [Edaphobacter lichenicola]